MKKRWIVGARVLIIVCSMCLITNNEAGTDDGRILNGTVEALKTSHGGIWASASNYVLEFLGGKCQCRDIKGPGMGSARAENSKAYWREV